MAPTDLVLESEALAVRLDARRGARVTSLVERASGRELLFRAPWPDREPPAPPAGEDAWTAAWPGGWDVLFPNAGGSCVVGGRRHGFHGEASLAAWDVEAAGRSSAVVAWGDGAGLRLRRAVSVSGAVLRIESEVVNEDAGERAFVLAEHLIFGEAVARGARLRAGALVTPLADEGGPVGEPSAWPRVRRDGRVEDWSASPDEPFSRFGVLSGVAGSRIAVAGASDAVVEVGWHGYPYAWLWHEHGASDGFPGGRPIACLGVEPATAPTSEGLGAALEQGHAVRLGGGERWDAAVTLSVGGPRLRPTAEPSRVGNRLL